jgi:hypothetical protein
MAKYYLGEYRAIDEYGDPIYHIRRKYHKTDAWRGYYETSVDGTIEYDAGADLWGESTDIRTLAERLHDDFKNGVLPIPVYIVTDPTSNVFAIAMSVLIAPRDKETLDLWLNGEYVEED